MAAVAASGSNALQEWSTFRAAHTGQMQLGFFSYDLKNGIETQLTSTNADDVALPDLYFFVPQTTIQFFNDRVEIKSTVIDPSIIWEQIQAITPIVGTTRLAVPIQHRTSKQQYIDDV